MSRSCDRLSEVSDSTSATSDNYIPRFCNRTGDDLLFSITCTATAAFLLLGYDQGVMSGIIYSPQFLLIFPDLNPDNVGSSRASTMQAVYTAVYELGCFSGAIFALLFRVRLGRRRCILIGTALVTVGTMIQITCVRCSLVGHQFVLGRIVTGFGNGLNAATVPNWQADCSKVHHRGPQICTQASMIAMGTMTAYWIDFGLSYVDSSLSWRLPIGLQIIFAIVLATGVLRLPESPGYLLSIGEEAEAERVLAALANEPIGSAYTRHEKRTIIEAEVEGKRRLMDLFKRGPQQNFRRTAISVSIQLFQQLGGCSAVIYFAPVIFNRYIGLERHLSLVLGAVNATIYALSSYLFYSLIERVGRQRILLWGTVGQAGCMLFAMAFLVPYDVYHDIENKAIYGAVAGLCLFTFAFGCTWLGLPLILPEEISPAAIRHNVNATCTIANRLFSFAVVMWTPPMLHRWGGFGTFLFFGLINLTFIPFIYAFCPETKDRSLKEIDVIFAKSYLESMPSVKVGNVMPKSTSLDLKSEAKQRALAKDVELGGSEEDKYRVQTMSSEQRFD